MGPDASVFMVHNYMKLVFIALITSWVWGALGLLSTTLSAHLPAFCVSWWYQCAWNLLCTSADKSLGPSRYEQKMEQNMNFLRHSFSFKTLPTTWSLHLLAVGMAWR